MCPTALNADIFTSILLTLVTPGTGGLVVAISLALEARWTYDRGVSGTVVLSAPVQTESLGRVPMILFFGPRSSGSSLQGYRRLWAILRIQGRCYLISGGALILDGEPEGHAIPISSVSRYPIPVRFIYEIPRFNKKVCERGF